MAMLGISVCLLVVSAEDGGGGGDSFSLREQIAAPTEEYFLSISCCNSCFSMLEALEQG